MKVYHEISPDAVGAALMNGLKRTSRGEKGSDDSIKKADAFLDAHCPAGLKELGLSRDNNLYAYISDDEDIVDIVDGSLVQLKDFISHSDQKVLEVRVEPRQCYVSDLDTYDALKNAIENNEDKQIVEQLAHSYWNKIKVLNQFNIGDIRRPEVMVTYDVDQVHIKLVN